MCGRREKPPHLRFFLRVQHAFIESIECLTRGKRLYLLTLVKAPASGGLVKLRIPVAIRTLLNRRDAIWRRILLDTLLREEIAPVTYGRTSLGQWLCCKGWLGYTTVFPHR